MPRDNRLPITPTITESRIITLLRGAESAARHGRHATKFRKRDAAMLLITTTYPAAFKGEGGI